VCQYLEGVIKQMTGQAQSDCNSAQQAYYNPPRRMRSSMLPMTGNRWLIRSGSSKNRPIAMSIKMITSAAISDMRKEPMVAVPPTIAHEAR